MFVSSNYRVTILKSPVSSKCPRRSMHMPQQSGMLPHAGIPASWEAEKESSEVIPVSASKCSSRFNTASLRKRNRCYSFLFLQPPTLNDTQQHVKCAYCTYKYSQQIANEKTNEIKVCSPCSCTDQQTVRVL